MILDDPEMFLHHVDFNRRAVIFVRVSRQVMDGRNFHNLDDIEPKYALGLDQLLDAADNRSYRPPHFLFMTDFCGSTLAANALRRLKDVSCFYEVRAFAGLAIRKRLLDRDAGSANRGGTDEWRRILRLVLGAVSSSSARRGTLIIKEWPPTNYIIPQILRCHKEIRAVFLYSDIEDYLNSVFRRAWRREFTRRRVITELIETDRWPAIHGAKHSFSDARIAAAHWFVQQQAFLSIDPELMPQIRSLHNTDLYNRPVETIAALASSFGIDAAPDAAAAPIASVSENHSKEPDMPYSMAERQKEVEFIARRYRGEIAEAVAQAAIWRETWPIPHRLPWSL